MFLTTWNVFTGNLHGSFYSIYHLPLTDATLVLNKSLYLTILSRHHTQKLQSIIRLETKSSRILPLIYAIKYDRT